MATSTWHRCQTRFSRNCQCRSEWCGVGVRLEGGLRTAALGSWSLFIPLSDRLFVFFTRVCPTPNSTSAHAWSLPTTLTAALPLDKKHTATPPCVASFDGHLLPHLTCTPHSSSIKNSNLYQHFTGSSASAAAAAELAARHPGCTRLPPALQPHNAANFNELQVAFLDSWKERCKLDNDKFTIVMTSSNKRIEVVKK